MESMTSVPYAYINRSLNFIVLGDETVDFDKVTRTICFKNSLFGKRVSFLRLDTIIHYDFGFWH